MIIVNKIRIGLIVLFGIAPAYIFGSNDSIKKIDFIVYGKGEASTLIPSKQIIISNRIFESNMIGASGRIEIGGQFSKKSFMTRLGIGYESMSFSKHMVVLEDSIFPTRSFRPRHKIQSLTSYLSVYYNLDLNEKTYLYAGIGIDFNYLISNKVKNNTLADDLYSVQPTSFGQYYVNYSNTYYYSPKVSFGSRFLLNNGNTIMIELCCSMVNLNGGYSLSNDTYAYLERFSYDASKFSIGIVYSLHRFR